MFSTLRGATWGLSSLLISQARHFQVSKEKTLRPPNGGFKKCVRGFHVGMFNSWAITKSLLER